MAHPELVVTGLVEVDAVLVEPSIGLVAEVVRVEVVVEGSSTGLTPCIGTSPLTIPFQFMKKVSVGVTGGSFERRGRTALLAEIALAAVGSADICLGPWTSTPLPEAIATW
jgi:hypothetical protein